MQQTVTSREPVLPAGVFRSNMALIARHRRAAFWAAAAALGFALLPATLPPLYDVTVVVGTSGIGVDEYRIGVSLRRPEILERVIAQEHLSWPAPRIAARLQAKAGGSMVRLSLRVHDPEEGRRILTMLAGEVTALIQPEVDRQWAMRKEAMAQFQELARKITEEVESSTAVVQAYIKKHRHAVDRRNAEQLRLVLSKYQDHQVAALNVLHRNAQQLEAEMSTLAPTGIVAVEVRPVSAWTEPARRAGAGAVIVWLLMWITVVVAEDRVTREAVPGLGPRAWLVPPVWLRRVTYQPWLIHLVRACRLRRLARIAYFRWVGAGQRVLPLSAGGITASYSVSTPEQLRAIESSWLCEEPVMDELVRTLEPGDVFYDVGSHLGLYAVWCGKIVGPQGRVVAFEPERSSYITLQQNLQLNELANVEAVPCALGDRSAEMELYVGGTIGNITLLPHAVVGKRADERAPQRVQVTPGDAIRLQRGLPAPRAVKIDVEGYEHAVLLGLRETLQLPACRLVCCEIHPAFLPDGITPQDVADVLRSYGYRVTALRAGTAPFHLFARKAGA